MEGQQVRVLVLGASGMLGNAMVRVLGEDAAFKVYGTVRSGGVKRFFSSEIADNLVVGIDVEQQDGLVRLFSTVRPDVVINCIGLIKQLAEAGDPLMAIPINSLLPHRLARLSELAGARLIHISTDCVFDGKKGGYTEGDQPNASDLYGLSKYLGEVGYPHTVTLRTSIIGQELNSTNGLIDWFLKQEDKCRGYTQAVFSGLPTVVLAQVVRDVVIPDKKLSGLYHVAAQPIAKFDLLRLVAEVYGKKIEIIPDGTLVINRSLKAERFRAATGYVAPEWPELIRVMHSYHQS